MTSSDNRPRLSAELGCLTHEQVMTLKALKRLTLARNTCCCLVSTLMVANEYHLNNAKRSPRDLASVGQRLRALSERGFVEEYHYGLKALWRLGPMADKLEEAGVL